MSRCQFVLLQTKVYFLKMKRNKNMSHLTFAVVSVECYCLYIHRSLQHCQLRRTEPVVAAPFSPGTSQTPRYPFIAAGSTSETVNQKTKIPNEKSNSKPCGQQADALTPTPLGQMVEIYNMLRVFKPTIN